MTTPLIDPSTLTEEQREKIKVQHKLNSILTQNKERNAFQIGVVETFEWLFGEEFLNEDGE